MNTKKNVGNINSALKQTIFIFFLSVKKKNNERIILFNLNVKLMNLEIVFIKVDIFFLLGSLDFRTNQITFDGCIFKVIGIDVSNFFSEKKRKDLLLQIERYHVRLLFAFFFLFETGKIKPSNTQITQTKIILSEINFISCHLKGLSIKSTKEFFIRNSHCVLLNAAQMDDRLDET